MPNTQKQEEVHCPGFRLGFHGAQIPNCHIRAVSWREALGVFSRTCERPTAILQPRLTSLGTVPVPPPNFCRFMSVSHTNPLSPACLQRVFSRPVASDFAESKATPKHQTDYITHGRFTWEVPAGLRVGGCLARSKRCSREVWKSSRSGQEGETLRIFLPSSPCF